MTTQVLTRHAAWSNASWRVRLTPWTAPLLASSLGVAGALPRLTWVAPVSDEGVVGSLSQLIASGQVPYRDFPMGWNPPEFWIVAGLFKLLGANYLWLRLSNVFGLILAAALVAVIASRVLRPAVAGVVVGFWAVVAAIHLDVSGYHFWEMATVAAAVLSLLTAVDRRDSRWLIACGALSTLCYWFVQPFGLLLPVLGAAAVACGFRWRSALRSGLTGAAAVSLPIFAALWFTGALPGWASQTLGSMFTHYSAVNGFPIPWWPFSTYFEDSGWTWDVWIFGGPLVFAYWIIDFVIPLALLPVTALASLRRLQLPTTLVVLCWATEAQFAGALIARRDGRMMWIASVMSLITAAALLRIYVPWRRPVLRRVIADVLVLCFGVGFGPAATAARIGCNVPAGTAGVIGVGAAPVCSDRDFVGTYQHAAEISVQHPSDKIVFLPELAGLYVLTKRTPPIEYPFLLPDYTSLGQYHEAERELVTRRVEWIVYTPNYSDRSGFAEFVASHYSVYATYDDGWEGLPISLYHLRSQHGD